MTQMLTLELLKLWSEQSLYFALQGLTKKLWHEQTVPQQAHSTQTIFWGLQLSKQTFCTS